MPGERVIFQRVLHLLGQTVEATTHIGDAAMIQILVPVGRVIIGEPEAWLRYVLGHIQDWPVNRLRDLLPWKTDLTSA